MLGLDPALVRDVPASDAHRLASQGSLVARFDCVDAAPDDEPQVDRVEVVDAGDCYVLRYDGIVPGVRVVDGDALPRLADRLLGGDVPGDWVVESPGERPSWLQI